MISNNTVKIYICNRKVNINSKLNLVEHMKIENTGSS